MPKKATDFVKYAKKFKETFGLNLNEYLDNFYLNNFNQVSIDLEKFEKWLNLQHGNFDDKSIADFVKEKYDIEAVNLIEELI